MNARVDFNEDEMFRSQQNSPHIIKYVFPSEPSSHEKENAALRMSLEEEIDVSDFLYEVLSAIKPKRLKKIHRRRRQQALDAYSLIRKNLVTNVSDISVINIPNLDQFVDNELSVVETLELFRDIAAEPSCFLNISPHFLSSVLDHIVELDAALQQQQGNLIAPQNANDLCFQQLETQLINARRSAQAAWESAVDDRVMIDKLITAFKEVINGVHHQRHHDLIDECSRRYAPAIVVTAHEGIADEDVVPFSPPSYTDGCC